MAELVSRIDSYVKWKAPTKIDFEQVLGKKDYEKYWSMWERINAELRECQTFADALRTKVMDALK